MLAIVGVWAALYAWRPWSFGLYHDDWYLLRAFSVDDARAAIGNMPTRPLLVLVNLIAGHVVGADPFWWQVLMALGVLLCAILLSVVFTPILERIADVAAETAVWAGAAVAIAWMVFPWTLGFTAFASTNNGLVGLLLFLSATSILWSDRSPLRRAFLSICVALALGLLFEALWGTLIVLAAARLVADRLDGRRQPGFQMAPVFAQVGVQVGLILYNRAWALLSIGQNKPLSSGAIGVFQSSVQRLWGEAKTGFFSHKVLGAAILAIALIAAWRLVTALPRQRLSVLTGLAVCLAGMAGSIVLYAMGGYVIETVGLTSRTTYGISLWLAVLFGLACGVAAGRSQRRGALVMVLSVVALAGFGRLQWEAGRSWAAVWRDERDLLSSFPVNDYVRLARPGTLLLVEGPEPRMGVYGLAAFWDISGALFTQFPQIASIHAQPGDVGTMSWIATMANLSRMRSNWSGAELEQGWCSPPLSLWKVRAPGGLLFWRMGTKSIEPVSEPTSFGCGGDAGASHATQ